MLIKPKYAHCPRPARKQRTRTIARLKTSLSYTLCAAFVITLFAISGYANTLSLNTCASLGHDKAYCITNINNF